MNRALATCLVGLSVAACAPSGAHQALPSPTPRRSGFARPSHLPKPVITDTYPAYRALARVPSVVVSRTPGGPVQVTLTNPQPSGAPLVFLKVGEQPGWVQVELPIRPNGTTGWVRAADVVVSGVAYRLDVLRAEHRLEVFKFGRLERTYPVGIGTNETPTPGGVFYLKELLQPPSPDGPYGPYAYGLSGHSNALTTFDGHDAVIGIHGTDHPELVGTDVSHGCIRMRNADISALVKELPLGTPVRILA